jgi:hypothetical protein
MSQQDKSYLSGGESDTERKPEPNKQLQTSSKRSSSSKGEVGIINLAMMNLHKNKQHQHLET